ncbi:hypothetical protein [Actinoplanes derwentensis]|uniref:MYXO-CTERM domain-containing protein n=1 Tax=Actinoplanes derwentensis TaxID=113562 RepID=A0A1H1X8W6_9ACTN|nr:hypothetical protein [Actinoplanes derwentensis]GID89608.1 hypothetical protein Ade03nite_85320 [Actinoplanes derwentensis]SDT05787.1 hypothetical protein SAMN04489716_2386 [Actinoplanes derwentensis]
MFAENVRDVAVNAAVLGFFASGWFGWAQEAPPRHWRRFLLAGSVAAVLTVVAGVLLAWRHWTGGTVFDEDTSRTFGIVVGIEFGVAALGAVLLAVLRRRDWTPAWIAFVVGVHLFPVAVIIEFPAIHVAGALITLVALAGIPVARSRGLNPSAVVGAGTGTVLLAGAVVSAAVAALS